MSLMIERARLLAKFVHADEIRKSGEPYYVHCDAVEEGLKNKSEVVRSAGQMHDIFEKADNPDLMRLLVKEYFPIEVYNLVEILTNKNMPYLQYIDIVCKDPDALSIKFSDMINNTKDIGRPYYTDKQKDKYRRACIHMLSNNIDIPKILKDRLNIREN